MSMATIRQWHFYIGMFIAPSVLFFALTGAVQLFSLHEAHGSYDPPPILEKLSAVHKDQVFAAGHHHHDADAAPKPAAAPAGPPPTDDDDKPKLTTLLLKSLFLVVALGLTVSTALGLWIGLTHPRYKRAALLLVIAGAVLPVVLLLV